ncbi:hypothetical protein C1H46_026173 [Malus baccata]|uniref:Aspergillus nuclease S1 n=1 Tax=Malus baccata TaxID=106549 RepID=A0A540LPV0_MALBA|nr:hypothetical protein C1H46_026173 [Malus baccata]
MVPRAQGWSKEGHMMTCRIAQALLEPEAAEAVQNLLPHYVDGDLSALCVWPDQIRHWYRYRWTSPLHFIDTPDNACTFDYSKDYFLPRLPVVEKRIAQGGVRLAAILNHVFSSGQDTGVDDDVSHSPT